MHGRLREPVKPALLHLDDALMQQGGLSARAARDGLSLDCRDLGPALRLWSRPGPLEMLEGRIREGFPLDRRPLVTFLGSGDFHHVTPMLVRRACDAAGTGAVTVIHFDNHPDWVRFGAGLHCGSWVGEIARDQRVARVFTVGVCSDDISERGRRSADADLIREGLVEMFAYRAPADREGLELFGRIWPTLTDLGLAAFALRLAESIPTRAIYVTIDKDVLAPEDAATNWDQGELSLYALKTLLGAVITGRTLIGADITGDWSPARYGGQGLDPWVKRAEAVMDQPWSRPGDGALRHNQAVNLHLLDWLSELAT